MPLTEKLKQSENNPIELIKQLGWISRLILIGSILMIIDACFELESSPFGFLVLIVSILIFLLAAQVSDENPYALHFSILVLVLNYITHFHFHSFVGLEWTVGLGIIGNIIVSLSASIALLFTIISIVTSNNGDPIQDRWLYVIGFIMVAINLLLYMIIVDFILTTTSMFALLYFSIILICTILMLLGSRMIPTLIITILTLLNAFGGALATPVSGFGAGMSIMGGIAFLYFLNEFGAYLAGAKK